MWLGPFKPFEGLREGYHSKGGMTMNRQWACQPLAIPGQDLWIVYRVRERLDTKGRLVSAKLLAEPGLFNETFARLMVTQLNGEGVENGKS